jgi:hypothetical protein
MLGLIIASFLIGIGIFHVPAGIIAAKYDPKKIAACGIMNVIIIFSSLWPIYGTVPNSCSKIPCRYWNGVFLWA